MVCVHGPWPQAYCFMFFLINLEAFNVFKWCLITLTAEIFGL